VRFFDPHKFTPMAQCGWALPPPPGWSNTLHRPRSSLLHLHEDRNTRVKFQSRGYDVLSRTWEDTGRSKGSCWGPNITDQTLNVGGEPASVIRKPNFTDETCDVDIGQFVLSVGNETGAAQLTEVGLKEYLQKLGWYRPRDEKIMVSTQACVLPLKDGVVQFGLDLYNYQTRPNDPSLAVIVSSAQGTSTAPITKQSQQTLFFNQNGRSHAFEARRLEDDRRERKVEGRAKLDLTAEEKQRNMLLVFHVPLKQKKVIRERGGYANACCAPSCNSYEECDDSYDPLCVAAACAMPQSSRGFDAAVLRVSSQDQGAFPGLKPGVTYERDDRFPIRCVIQNYAATDATTVDDAIVDYIVGRLSTVYSRASAQGSHVVGTGDQGRLTAPQQVPGDPTRTFATPLPPPALFNAL